MDRTEGALTDVVAELRRAAGENDSDKVKVGHLIDALDYRGYGPALAVLPLIELTPLGGIPGFPTLLALLLASITLRLLLGYEHFWAPEWLRRRKISSDKVIKAMDWLKPLSQRIDGKLHERLSHLAGPSARRVACIIILVLLFTVPPLEIVPFATSAPMIVVSIFGLGLLYRDGLLMLFAFAGALIAAMIGGWWFFGTGGA